MKWYQHDPNAFSEGVAGLTLQEVGAYILILDAIYARDGELPNDDALLKCILRCHGHTWNALKRSLIAKGKIWIWGSKITAKRVQTTLKHAANFSETQRKRANKRWKSTNDG